MRNDGLRILLEVVRRKPVLLRGYESGEEAPGAARDQPQLRWPVLRPGACAAVSCGGMLIARAISGEAHHSSTKGAAIGTVTG